MINVTLYIHGDCHACDQAMADLRSLQPSIPHNLAVVNVDQNRSGKDSIETDLPIVEIGPYRLRSPFTRQDLQIMLNAARDRIDQLEQVDLEGYQQRLDRGMRMSTSDKLTRFLAEHYLALVNILLLLYAGLPFLAPVLMKTDHPVVASVIYKVYSPMCHQLAFRSWFLFGEQAYYPRELAGATGVVPYEILANTKDIDIIAARNFVGNAVSGYKVALCQRDIAIYAAMLLFGLIYSLSGRRLRSLPWYIWVFLGIGPIGLDGFSQLPSLAASLPAWLPLRESTPLLRTITGGLFGLLTAWYLFPLLEETSVETRRIFRRKRAVIEQSGSES